MNDALQRLARSLSPGARELLLMSEAELERENRRTRAFIEKPRFPNPLRVVHAQEHRAEWLDEAPSGRGLTDAERQLILDLRFFPCGVSKAKNARSERWVGPDGCTVLSFTPTRRFLSVAFEDGKQISMWPEVADRTRELLPNKEFMESSPDLFDDYRRVLEKTAEWMERRNARPLYRHRDAELDLAIEDFYLRHQVSTRFVRFAQKQRLLGWIGDEMSDVFVAALDGEVAEAIVEEVGPGAEGTETSVRYRCRSCEATTPVEFGQVGENVPCQACDKTLSTADVVIDVSIETMLDRLIGECQLPVVLGFWAMTALPSVSAISTMHDVALTSDGQYILARIDTGALGDAERIYGVEELPTFVRFAGGSEVGRLEGRTTARELRRFATG